MLLLALISAMSVHLSKWPVFHARSAPVTALLPFDGAGSEQ